MPIDYGADRIWIVNVGDLEADGVSHRVLSESCVESRKWPKEKLAEFTKLWATREFGPKYAAEIADIVSKYTKYNGRRKPELLEPDTFSLINYQEADRVWREWKAITDKAEAYLRTASGRISAMRSSNSCSIPRKHPRKSPSSTLPRERIICMLSQGRASANDRSAASHAHCFRRRGTCRRIQPQTRPSANGTT